MRHAVLTVLCSSAFVLLATGPASAQRQPIPDWRSTRTFGLGYVGNGPRALLGANVYLMLPVAGGLGVYADFKITPESFEDSELMQSGITRAQAEEFQDVFEAENEHWYVMNLAVMRPVTSELALYVGGGYGHKTSYRDYFDESRSRGLAGQYRIEDKPGSGAHLNALGGAVFRAGRRIAFHFGAEAAPAGFNAGASLLFPLR